MKMKATIDKASRLLMPKAIRQSARLEPGTEVESRIVAGKVEIERVPLDVTLERHGLLVVAVPRKNQPTLTESEVEETIVNLREKREDETSG